MFPSPPHKKPMLIGTAIISPPAKTIKSERDIKKEDDWLNLPKNKLKDTQSLMDPAVQFTIRHTDSSICQHKKTWVFYNCKPPAQDTELPDLDDESRPTPISQKYNLCSTTPHEDIAVVNASTCLDDSINVSAENIMADTNVTTEKCNSDKNSMANVNQSKTVTTENTPVIAKANSNLDASKLNHVHTENDRTTNQGQSNETSHKDLNTTENADRTLAETEASNMENPDGTVHTENIAVCTENPKTLQLDQSTHVENNSVNTENLHTMELSHADETDHCVHTENNPSTSQDLGKDLAVNNTSTSKKDTTDWEQLMINSDDSLFEEMTKQMNNQQPNQPNTSTLASPTTNKPIESSEKLPDLTQNNEDTVTGLLMFSASVNLSMDQEVDDALDAVNENEHILPVNAPKMPDFAKDMAEAAEKDKNNKDTTSIKTGKVNTRDKPKTEHTNSKCEVCNKTFVTKRSLRKHSYTHLEKQIECEDCNKKFSFKSELEIHRVKHTEKPTHRCTVIGCNDKYFRKSELTAHMVNHVGPAIKCPEEGCTYEHTDKCYVKQH